MEGSALNQQDLISAQHMQLSRRAVGFKELVKFKEIIQICECLLGYQII